MKKKTFISIAFIALLITCITLAFSDDHRFNIPYLTWKWGWTKYSPEISMHYMSTDSAFQNSLKGMDKTEVMKWFPDLRTEMNPDKYLDSSQPFFMDSPDFLWIGDTQWAIVFETNRVKDFCLIKGIPKLKNRKHYSARKE